MRASEKKRTITTTNKIESLRAGRKKNEVVSCEGVSKRGTERNWGKKVKIKKPLLLQSRERGLRDCSQRRVKYTYITRICTPRKSDSASRAEIEDKK